MVQNGGSDHIYRKAYAQQSPRERAHTEMAPPPLPPLRARPPPSWGQHPCTPVRDTEI